MGIKSRAGFQILACRQIVPAAQKDTMLCQRRHEAVAKTLGLLAEHRKQFFPQLLQQLEPFRGQRLTQDGDPFHEELIEVGGKDRQEFGAFEQRRALVHRLSQDAVVKVKPAQVPIDPDVRQRRSNLYVQHSFIADRHDCLCGAHMLLLWFVKKGFVLPACQVKMKKPQASLLWYVAWLAVTPLLPRERLGPC